MYQNNYNLNFVPGGVPLTIHISQYDVGTRTFHFTPIAVPGTVTTFTGASATLEATKPDGYAVIQNCTYNSDGTIDYTVQEQLAAKAGKVWSKIVLRNGSDVIGTAAVVWIVDKAGVTDDAVISDSDIRGMQAYVDQLKTLVGTPVAVSTAAGMTDTGKIYLYTGSETGYTSGNWYYYNGTAWVSGGVYGGSDVEVDPTLSIAGEAADAKATGDAVNDLKSAIGQPVHAELEIGAMANGSDVANTSAVRTKGYILAPTGTYITANKYNNKNYVVYLYFYDDKYTYLDSYNLNISNEVGTVVPQNAVYLRYFVWVIPGLEPEITDAIKTAISNGISIWAVKGIQENRKTINLIEAEITDIKTTNPVLEMGAMVNGKPSASTSAVRFAEYYLTEPNDKVYISKYNGINWTANFYYYDEQFNYLTYETLNTGNGTYITVPANTRYIRFFAWAVSSLTPSITTEFLEAFSKCIWFYVDDYLINRAIQENGERITAIETVDNIPSYFDSQIDDVKEDIIEHGEIAGKNGTSFVFCTDIHWDRNYKNSPSLIKKLSKETFVNKCVLGGDYISQFESNKQTAIDTLYECMEKYRETMHYVLPIFGNHDRNSNHNGSSSVYLSKAETFSLINSWMNLIVGYGEYFNFYADDQKCKTRYICIDTGAEKIDGGQISATTLAWVQTLIDELDAEWHIIIFAHWLFSPTTYNEPLVDGVLTGSYTESAQTLFTQLDTSNATGTKAFVEGIITGHVHCDYNDETTGGIPIIFTDTDSRDAFGEYTATQGTVSEQCFDVITFDYEGKTIYCDRVGRGVSREISYA